MHKFMNLLAVATADHQLTEREIKYLTKRAKELKLTDHQYNLAMNRALAHPGEVQIPRRKSDRNELMRDMLRVMAADGNLAEVEKQLFAIVAAYMKFEKPQVEALIDDVLKEDLAQELPPAQKSPAKKAPPKTPPRSAKLASKPKPKSLAAKSPKRK